MSLLLNLLVLLVQIILGLFLGFGVANALGVGNGWELVIIPLGNALGVWGIGALAAWQRQEFRVSLYRLRLLSALIGAFAGSLLILLTPPFGYAQLLMPLLGALLGYYGIRPRRS